MYKIAAIGDRISVEGFASVGFDVFAAENTIEVERVLGSVDPSEYAIIYITEQAARTSADTIEKLGGGVTPAVILIPGREGSLGIGMQGVKKSVERAVGADILKD